VGEKVGNKKGKEQMEGFLKRFKTVKGGVKNSLKIKELGGGGTNCGFL